MEHCNKTKFKNKHILNISENVFKISVATKD